MLQCPVLSDGRSESGTGGFGLNPFNLNDFIESCEIFDVVRQQAVDVVGKHGGDDIGIVNLLATN